MERIIGVLRREDPSVVSASVLLRLEGALAWTSDDEKLSADLPRLKPLAERLGGLIDRWKRAGLVDPHFPSNWVARVVLSLVTTHLPRCNRDRNPSSATAGPAADEGPLLAQLLLDGLRAAGRRDGD